MTEQKNSETTVLKVNILGTEYTVEEKSEAEDSALKKCDGYCDKTSKKIVIKLEDSTCDLDDYGVYRKVLLRHEIIHAFLFESGLHENFHHAEWGHDETTVDWIATQFCKIQKAYEDVGAL